MSPDSVVLDVFFVRLPFGDPTLNGSLWREIDEQSLPADCRRKLLANGFRAGLLAGQLPQELSELFQLAEENSLPGEVRPCKPADLTERPKVMRGHYQLRNEVRKDMVTSPILDELPLLLRDESGHVSGKTYFKAQTRFAVTAKPLKDGRVRLELVPEITHGQYTQGWTMDTQGIMQLSPGRKSRVFNDLKLDVDLSPGHMLVLSTTPSHPGSLGYHFFSEKDQQGTTQKLMVIRLSQTQHDAEFERTADLVIE